MSQHPNVDRLRQGLKLRNQHELSADEHEWLHDLFDPDAVWHGGGKVFNADTRGREAVFGLFRYMAEQSAGSLREEVEEIFADDTHGVGVVRLTAELPGRRLEWREVNIFHMTPEGRISDIWGVPDDQEAVDNFWSEPAASPT